MIEVITKDLKDKILDFFSKSENSIRIVSPFMSVNTADILRNIKKSKPELECTVITRIYINDLLQGVNSLEAIEKLVKAGIKVYALQGLHAKVYDFDEETVIIGSANFTLSGLRKNFEMSIITDEENAVITAGNLLDELEEHCSTNNGVITNELLEEIQSQYDKAYNQRQKDFGTVSLAMYGATRVNMGGLVDRSGKWKLEDVTTVEEDPVYTILNEPKARKADFKHNIWAKFEGKADDRQPGDELPSLSRVMIDGESRFVINFRNKPSGIKDGDQIYFVSLTNDEKGKATTRIVGRGFAKVYQNRNRVHSEWLTDYPWMKYYCYFCEVTNVELLNLERIKCIPLDQVYDVLDKRTYTSTIDKEEVKNMSLCQCRRSHLQMTLDAKEYIDNEIDKLANKYGFIENIQNRKR